MPAGERCAVLEYLLEAPGTMSAWTINQILKRSTVCEGATLKTTRKGPHLATIQVENTLHESKFTLEISLAAGVPRVDFTLKVNWLERGGLETGTPMLQGRVPAGDQRRSGHL